MVGEPQARAGHGNDLFAERQRRVIDGAHHDFLIRLRNCTKQHSETRVFAKLALSGSTMGNRVVMGVR